MACQWGLTYPLHEGLVYVIRLGLYSCGISDIQELSHISPIGFSWLKGLRLAHPIQTGKIDAGGERKTPCFYRNLHAIHYFLSIRGHTALLSPHSAVKVSSISLLRSSTESLARVRSDCAI